MFASHSEINWVQIARKWDQEMNLREAVRFVALLNIAYFGVEIIVGLWIGSVALFADSIDFLEDASVNLLILLAIGWSASRRSKFGAVLAAMLIVPCFATVVMACYKFSVPFAPAPLPLILIGLGALMINLGCAYTLASCRRTGGSLARAAFLATRNDAMANIAIAGAGIITAIVPSAWPDLIVGLGIAFLNVAAVRRVYWAALEERSHPVVVK
jgi:Co/Zn/Cd efflux system component